MVREPVWRRLAVVLAADVAGFNRLTGLDGEGTGARLMGRLRVSPIQTSASTAGQSLRTPPAACRRSSAMSRMLWAAPGGARRNTEMPEERRTEFRVGGGICRSARVAEYKQGQLDLFFEGAAQQQLKNIARLRACDIPRARNSKECVGLLARHTTPAPTTILVHHSLR